MMKVNYCFDMDGTIADLYGQEEWLEKLENSDPSPFYDANPLINMDELNKAIDEIHKRGDTVSIISWTSKTGTPEYNKEVRKAKIAWLAKYGIEYDECHIIKYGTPKSKFFHKDKINVMFDDCGYAVVGHTKKKHIVIDDCHKIISTTAIHFKSPEA